MGTDLGRESGHVGFVLDEVALEQVFSEYFGFPPPDLIPLKCFILIYHPREEQ
jgi:hypothetical protein